MKQEEIKILVARFLNRGGTINSYYLQENLRSKQALVHLNGWFSGRNVREAITKALCGRS